MKKIFALATALVLALCAMSIVAFADEVVVYDNEEGTTLYADGHYADPWDGFGIGSNVNVGNIGDITWEDFVNIVKAGDAKVVITFKATSLATWGGGAMQGQFNCWENEDNLQVNPEVTELGDGMYTTVLNIDDCVAKLEAAGGSVDTANNFGIQLWVDECVIYSVKLVTGDVEVTAPAADDTTAETPADDTTAEVPADETTENTETAEETTPAETGIALAIVPMVVAAAAVAVSKRR